MKIGFSLVIMFLKIRIRKSSYRQRTRFSLRLLEVTDVVGSVSDDELGDELYQVGDVTGGELLDVEQVVGLYEE